ncbi:MAG: substrate-binding domain-containing protein [Pseudomonadota bacterium]
MSSVSISVSKSRETNTVMVSKTLKRILLITLILFGAAACDTSTQSPKQTQPNNLEKRFKIATLVKVDGIPWFARMRVGVMRFAQDTGQDAFMVGPARADGTLQAQMIDELIEQEVDAICIVPFSVPAVESSLKKAREKGIVIVAHEASNMLNADVILEPFDNVAWGSHLMDELASRMNHTGTYAVIIGGYGSQSHKEWLEAAISRQLEKYPDMKLVSDAIEDHDNPARSYARVKELLEKFPDLRGILGFTMASAPSAALAVETAGRQDTVNVVGVSLPSACKSYLEEGSLETISFWDPADAGYAMNVAALMTLRGTKIHNGTDLGVRGYQNLRENRLKSNLFLGRAG